MKQSKGLDGDLKQGHKKTTKQLYDQSVRCLHEETLHPWSSKIAQADLNLHWAHLSEGKFSQVEAHFFLQLHKITYKKK